MWWLKSRYLYLVVDLMMTRKRSLGPVTTSFGWGIQLCIALLKQQNGIYSWMKEFIWNDNYLLKLRIISIQGWIGLVFSHRNLKSGYQLSEMTEGSTSNRLKMLIRIYWLYQATMSNAEITKACPSPIQNLCILHLPF